MIRPLLILAMVATLIAPSSEAASKSPSPSSKTSSAKNAPASKSSIKKAATSKKPVVKKKTVTKTKQRIKSKLSPSPSPKWPPKGFKSNAEVYAKIPTAKELISTASNSAILTRQLAKLVDGVPVCEKYSCGAVQLASLNGCTWWEITATLVGVTSAEDKSIRSFGTIRTLIKSTLPKQIVTVLLISQEPLEFKHAVTSIAANCHHDATSEKIPSTTYTQSEN